MLPVRFKAGQRHAIAGHSYDGGIADRRQYVVANARPAQVCDAQTAAPHLVELDHLVELIGQRQRAGRSRARSRLVLVKPGGG